MTDRLWKRVDAIEQRQSARAGGLNWRREFDLLIGIRNLPAYPI